MTVSRYQLLDEALALSERMAELGDVGDWDAVIDLEPQRRTLLEAAFATHAPVDAVVAERVKAILELDRKLMAKSIAARDQLAAEISRVAKGRKASSAYHAASR